MIERLNVAREFQRKNIRLAREHYVGKRSHFVTTCCHFRRPFLADPVVAAWVIRMLQRFAVRFGFAVHAYCAMPDHLHFLVLGLHDQSDLLQFVDSFKQHTGYRYEQRKRRRLWQFKFFDHILRRADGIDDVSAYVWMNPVRKGLCTDPLAYPFSGSFTIRWASHPVSPSAWEPSWKRPFPRECRAEARRYMK